MAIRIMDSIKTANDSTEFPVAFGDSIWLNKDKNGATEDYSDLQTMYNNDLLGSGGSSIQVDTMPIASEYPNEIVQYVGESGTYQNGYFYQSTSDEKNPPTYSWVQKNVQPNEVEKLDVTEIKVENFKTEEPIFSNAVVGYDENGKMIPIKIAELEEKVDKDLANATGTLPVANGGTGATTAKGAQKSLLSDMQTETTAIDDSTEFVMKYGTPTDTKGALFKRSATLVWNYIKGKISSVLGLTATKYNGIAKGANQIAFNYTIVPITNVTSGTLKYIKLADCNWNDAGTLQVYMGGDSFHDTLVINFGGGNATTPMLCGYYSGNYRQIKSVIAQKGSDERSNYSIYAKVKQVTNLTVEVALIKGSGKINITESTTAPTNISEWTVNYGLFGTLTGNVSGNVSGSSGSCTGNSATATRASTSEIADKTVNDITIDIPYVTESGQYVIPLGNIPEPTSTATDSPYNWDITGFFSIIRPSGHNGSHLWFEAGHGFSHAWTTYAYLDKFDFIGVATSIKAFQYNGEWWLGLCISTGHQGYVGKMTITYSRGLPAMPTCVLYYSQSGGVANAEIYNSIQDIPSSWWKKRVIYNPTTFIQDITAPNITSLEQRVTALESKLLKGE